MTPATVHVVQDEPFRKVGLGYVWDHPEYSIRLTAEGLRERSDELSAEITIEDVRKQHAAHMVLHRMNLMSRQTRTGLARELTDQCADDDDFMGIDWKRLIEHFCMGVIKRSREGEPTLHVASLKRHVRQPDLVDRVLPAGKPTLWYGPQGAGKGWLCVQCAVRVSGGINFPGLKVNRSAPVLYLDWEDNEDTFEARVSAVVNGLDVTFDRDPPVYYKKMHGQLVRQIPRVLSKIQEHGIELVIVDSVGLAMGAKSEGGNGYEDQAIAFFEAIRFLEPAAVLLVDHVTGDSATNGRVAGKAFGSIYKMAEARAAWEIRKEQDADSDEQIIGMHHTKHNHTKKYRPIGFKIEFENDDEDQLVSVRLVSQDLGDTVELRHQLPQKDQILNYLRGGASTTEAIADSCCKGSQDQVRALLSRLRRDGKVTKLDDGRWGLAFGKPRIVDTPDA